MKISPRRFTLYLLEGSIHIYKLHTIPTLKHSSYHDYSDQNDLCYQCIVQMC